jgi:RimJ/RimL family protein N-acetyltransferase
MSDRTLNALGQPIGLPLPNWTPPERPPRTTLIGRYCRVEPLDVDRHAAQLFAANSEDVERRNWTYLPYGPFDTYDDYVAWMKRFCFTDAHLFYAIIDLKTVAAVGVASYLRIDPAAGSIEVGSINFSPRLQRTPVATEAMYLMMQHVFTLGYRRYEWKCDSLNAKSRAAAQRFGFSFEGIFRQATVYKGRNRDTAWFAVIDSEWPQVEVAYLKWLDLANFDADGQQRVSLSSLTAPILKMRDS